MAQLQSTSITGSLIVTQGITGSFSGSATNAISASYAATASYALNAGDSIWTGSAGDIYYSGGNVGIGTASPSVKLDVNGRVTVGGGLNGNALSIATSIGTYTFNNYDFQTPSSFLITAGSSGYLSLDGYPVIFKVTGTERMRVDTSGNVGIGVTNPAYKLHVENNLNGGLLQALRNTNTGTSQYVEFKLGTSDSSELRLGSSYNYVASEWNQTWIYAVNRNLALKTSAGFDIRFYAGGTDDSYERMRVTNGGNVGIGTTNPTETLSISGTSTSGVGISLANGDGTGGRILADNSSLYFYSNSGTLVYSLKNSKIRLNDGNGGTIGVELGSGGSISQNGNGGGLTFSDTTAYLSNGLVVSAGNVGIGTTSPSEKLSVYGNIKVDSNDAASQLGFYNSGVFLGTIGKGNYAVSGADYTGISMGSQGAMSFATGGNTERMRIVSGGNVGIGTTSPGYKLDVNGDTNITGNLYFNSNSTLQPARRYVSTANLSSAGYTVIGTVTGDALASSIRISLQGTTSSTVINVMADILVNHYQDILITSYAGMYTTLTLRVVSNNNEIYSIEATTDSANACTTYIEIFPLNSETVVFGGSAQTGTSLTHPCVPGMNVSATGGNSGNLAVGGDVGIGTTSPGYKLDVAGTSRSDMHIFRSNQSAPTADAFIFRPANNTVALGTANNERVRIDASGNVGIGITTPAQKLHVEGITRLGGSTADGALYVYSSNGTLNSLISGPGNTYLNATYGNVGIGTTSPLATLQITGLAANSGSSSANNPSGTLLLATDSGFNAQSYGSSLVFSQRWFNGLSNQVAVGQITGVKIGGDGTFGGGLAFWTSNTTTNSLVERVRITDNGNVGIGTTSPTTPLRVEGGGVMTGGWNKNTTLAATYPVLIFNSNATKWAGVGYDYSEGLRVWLNATSDDVNTVTPQFNILNNGNVGIGTGSPSQKFVVSNGSAEVFKVYSTGEVIVGTNYIYAAASGNSFYSEAAANFRGGIRNDVGAYLQIDGGSSGNTYFNGNVGIGTTTPSHNLHIYGAGDRLIKIENTGTYLMYAGLISNEGYIGSSNATPLGFYTNSVNRLYINTSGNIGIGTTSPGYKLDVQGNSGLITINTNGLLSAGGQIISGTGEFASSSSGTDLNFRAGATHLMVLKTTGCVGIGTTAPASMLHIYGSGNTFTRYTNTTSAGHYIDVGANSAGESFVYGYGAYPVLFGTNATERMRITSGGNVGIGTTTPAVTLQVDASGGGLIRATRTSAGSGYIQIEADGTNGTLTANNILYLNAGGSTKMTVLSGGNVGIGTTSPGSKLHVNGAITVGASISSFVYGTLSYVDATDGVTLTAPGQNMTLVTGYNEKITIKSGQNGLQLQTNDGVGNYTDRFLINQTRSYFNTNVGIGVTNPDQPLAFTDSLGTKIQFNGINGNGYQIGLASAVAGGDAMFKFTAGEIGAGEFGFYNTTNLRMLIDASGNVGIGTTSPSNGKLQVNGRIYTVGTAGTANAIFQGGQLEFYKDATPTYAASIGLSGPSSGGTNDIVFETYGGTWSERMRIATGGNVGIGTTSPTHKLQVVGPGTFASSTTSINGNVGLYLGIGGSTSNYNGILFQGVSTYDMYFGRAAGAGVDDLVINNGSSELVRFKSTGNVGIGTTAPSVALHIARTAAVSPSIRLHTTDSTTNGSIQWTNSGNSVLAFIGSNSNISDGSGNLEFATGGTTTRMVINSGGNVGIGTTNPGAKLEVAGTSLFSNEQSISYTNSIQSMYGGTGYSLFRMYGNSNGVEMQIDAHSHNSGAATVGTYSNSDVFIKTNQTNRMVVKGGGNVGIGVTNPGNLLTVGGNMRLVTGTLDGLFAYDAATGGAFIWSITRYTDINANDININARSGFAIRTGVESLTNSGHQFYVTSGGNVGIGVTAPAAKLQVSGSSNVLNVRGSGSAATSSIFSVDGTNGRLFEVSDDLSNSLFSVNTIAGLPVIEAFADYTVTMGTYGAYTLQVTGSRVGVGTSSPGYPLHVSGSVSGISIYATNDIAAFSDQSVKTDLQVIDSAVDRIKQINGYTYVRVDDLSNTRRAGVIAQEVQKVLPEVVSENNDGTLNVAYSNMIALLIEGMKEQQSQIDKLREDLEDLRYEL